MFSIVGLTRDLSYQHCSEALKAQPSMEAFMLFLG